jgi:hypothetical protein
VVERFHPDKSVLVEKCVFVQWAKKNLSGQKNLGKNPQWPAQRHEQQKPALSFLGYEYKNAFSMKSSQVGHEWFYCTGVPLMSLKLTAHLAHMVEEWTAHPRNRM